MIWSGVLGNVVSDGELLSFCEQFRPLPIVCVGRKVEGFPFVDVD